MEIFSRRGSAHLATNGKSNADDFGDVRCLSRKPKMKKMRIVVDPRMELLTALQVLAGDPNISRNSENRYFQDMLAWFTPYQNHDAVSHYKKINVFFSYDAPINSMLYMEFENELRLIHEPSEYLFCRAGSKLNWMEFYASLHDFAMDTGFKEFFKEHCGYYRQILEKVSAINGNCDPATELESYIGLNAKHYTFRFSPLQTCGYGACNVPQAEHISCTIGFDPYEENNREEICLRVYLWHEFAHGHVNPIIDEYMARNSADWQAFEKLISSLNIDEEKQPDINIYECFVRALTYKLICRYYNNQEAEGILKWDEEQGFAYIRHFIHALDKYDKARTPMAVNIKEYFPTLIREAILDKKSSI